MIEPGTILNERYKLIKTLGEGGYGQRLFGTRSDP